MRAKVSHFLLQVRAGRMPRDHRSGECQILEPCPGDGGRHFRSTGEEESSYTFEPLSAVAVVMGD